LRSRWTRLLLRLPPLLRPGAGVKRWLLLALAGFLIAGISSCFYYDALPLGTFLLLLFGLVCAIVGIAAFARNLVRLPTGLKGRQSYGERLYALNVLSKGPSVAALGGGSGLASLLRGLKQVTSNITAIVTVADDGGGSGMIRDDLGILPPGDIRNCILALSEAEPVMEQLLQYRFPEGQLKGQSFGNLLLAAMADTSGGFLEGVGRVSDILNVEGRVLPVTLDDIILKAQLKSGEVINGESNIGMSQRTRGSRIEKLWLDPADCTPVPEAIAAIDSADLIIIGPGSLYTSLLPNLLVPDIAAAIRRSTAPKVYVLNLMTQPGETEGYGAAEHLRTLEAHCGPGLVQYVLANNDFNMPPELLQRYAEDGAQPVVCDRPQLEKMGYRVVEHSLLKVSRDMVRHSYSGLASAMTEIYKMGRKK
jgi:uncharacterized cofD-like protein